MSAMAQRIRAARLEAGMTQRQLARMTGTTPPTICRIETGAQTASYPTLAAIARATATPISVLDPERRARGHTPTRLARHIDAAGPDGITRRQLWIHTERTQIPDAAALDAALTPLLACGAYETLQRHTRGRTATAYRRVQPREAS